MILIVSIVIIIISLVAFIFYRKNSDDVGLQNLGLSKKQKAKLKKAAAESKASKDPCEWVKYLRKS